MTKYKLLKDLPTFNKGDVFFISKQGNLIAETTASRPEQMIYTKLTLKKHSNILQNWFEKIKEPEIWKPKNGEEYWYVNDLYGALTDFWDDTDSDQFRYEIGNCFKTKEEAELELKKWERCLELGKPFALLLPVNILSDSVINATVKDYDKLSLLIPSRRMRFYNAFTGETGKQPTFKACYFGIDFFEEPIILVDMELK